MGPDVPNLASLRGRAVLLTGATGSLGQATARACCRAGARLLLSATDQAALDALARELSAADVATCAADLSSEREVTRLAAEARRRFGGLDVLINAAAILGPVGSLSDVDWEAWKAAISTNLVGAAYLCRECAPLMPLGEGRGKIVNLSGGGATSPRPGFSAYAAAKTALVRLSETLARELGPRAIDVNCIAPGIMNSRLTQAVVQAGPERAGKSEYEHALRAVNGEFDNCERAAELAVFLASSRSDGITGRLISAVWDDWEQGLWENLASAPDMYTLRRVVPQRQLAASTPAAAPQARPLHVCVAGLWHLGSVTAACLGAAGHHVVGYDDDVATVAGLRAGVPPIEEPRLGELIRTASETGHLRFDEAPSAAGSADVVWITWDTPVSADDVSDVESVIARVERLFPHLRSDALVVVSSQLPVGTIAALERKLSALRPTADVSFACIPENLRLGQAIDVFTRPDRVVAGIRRPADRERIEALIAPFTTNIEWMRVESAEMSKHAINAFLAASITFMNEIGTLCEQVGADAQEVSRALKSEARIGPRAYLAPGAAFAGGTLARDVVTLSGLADSRAPVPVIAAIRESNDAHRQWAARRLREEWGTVAGHSVALWGLTYKPHTNTLRRSSAVELCEYLVDNGAQVTAYDPAIRSLPEHLANRVVLTGNARDAVRGAEALVLATEWPEFRAAAAALEITDRSPVVLDAGRFLAAALEHRPGVRYISVGRQQGQA